MTPREAAEAMREAAAKLCENHCWGIAADIFRRLPLPAALAAEGSASDGQEAVAVVTNNNQPGEGMHLIRSSIPTLDVGTKLYLGAPNAQEVKRYALSPDNGLMYESSRGPWMRFTDAAAPNAQEAGGLRRALAICNNEIREASMHGSDASARDCVVEIQRALEGTPNAQEAGEGERERMVSTKLVNRTINALLSAKALPEESLALLRSLAAARPVQATGESERERFEASTPRFHFDYSRAPIGWGNEDGSRYLHPHIQSRWEGWQAALATPRPAAEPDSAERLAAMQAQPLAIGSPAERDLCREVAMFEHDEQTVYDLAHACFQLGRAYTNAFADSAERLDAAR